MIDNAENDEFAYCEDELQKAKEFFQNPPCLMCTGERTKLTAEFPFAKFSQLLTVNPKYRQKEGLEPEPSGWTWKRQEYPTKTKWDAMLTSIVFVTLGELICNVTGSIRESPWN